MGVCKVSMPSIGAGALYRSMGRPSEIVDSSL